MVDTADLKSVASNSVPVQVRPSVPSLNFIGPLAQRLEQGTHNPLVVGSNPTGPTILKSLSSMGKGFFIPNFLGEGYLDGLFSHLFRKAISLMKLLKRS